MMVAMSLIHFLSKSRGTRNLVSRIRTVLGRFGISSKRFEHLLNRYSAITHNLGCKFTLAVTAVTLKSHPKQVRRLHKQGVEFAIHGYIHTDYSVLPLAEQAIHFKKAIATFKNCQITWQLGSKCIRTLICPDNRDSMPPDFYII